MAAIYSGTGGFLDRIKVERVREFHEMMLQRLHSENSELMDQIGQGNWDDSIESSLGKSIAEAIDDFGPDFDAEGNPLEEGESDRILSEEEREKEARTDEGRKASSEDNGSGDDQESEDEDEDQSGGDEDAEAEAEETAKA